MRLAGTAMTLRISAGRTLRSTQSSATTSTGTTCGPRSRECRARQARRTEQTAGRLWHLTLLAAAARLDELSLQDALASMAEDDAAGGGQPLAKDQALGLLGVNG